MKNLKVIKNIGGRILLAIVFILPLVLGFANPALAKGNFHPAGAVYTITNSADGNEVVVYQRSITGALAYQGAYSTGGLGSGGGLGSQGAVILNNSNHLLFAVNAGSNQVSTFAVHGDDLQLIDVVDSGGEKPISLTVQGGLLYVLNTGGSGNITGFRVHGNGSLTPLPNSTQTLSNAGVGDAPGPAQISFSPSGRFLVVTEKGTNLIDTYPVNHGIPGVLTSYPSVGATPFGFAFDGRGHLVVSEAFGGAADVSALSSYQVFGGSFDVISPSVGTTQTAACWVVISKFGRYAYTTNAGSGSVSSYEIGNDGSLTLLEAQAGLTGDGSSPIDMSLSDNGRFLYVLGGKSHTVSTFFVKFDGSLVSLGATDVPAGSVGLAAQ